MLDKFKELESALDRKSLPFFGAEKLRLGEYSSVAESVSKNLVCKDDILDDCCRSSSSDYS